MASGSGLDFDVEKPPKHPHLHSKKQKLTSVLNPDYWKQLCPQLHVVEQARLAAVEPIQLADGRLQDLREQVDANGVTQVAPEELPWSVDHDQLAAAVVTLMRHGWPPSMLLVYDEVWTLVQQASQLMHKATGGNACNMDILCWCVDPNAGGAGFSPHRDRQPDDSPATFRPDGSPMFATLWTPLTHATPENSCLYVIPRFADPGYFVGDPEDEGAPDPLTAALPSKEAYQHIRALPAAPGAALIFTHRTIHWGSKGRRGYPTPRISVSWGCADDAFEPPYFSRQHLPCPPLELRLALIGGQMICYHERFPAPPKQLALYHQLFKAQADQFDGAYRSKVVREFMDASKEATAAEAAAASAAAAAPAAVAAGGGGRKGGAAGEAAAASKRGAKKGKPAGEQLQPQQPQKQKRKKGADAAAAPAADRQPAAAPSSKKHKKQQQQQQQQVKSSKAAAAAAASSEEEDGEEVDWAAIAKAAKAAAAAAKQGKKGKKKSRRSSKAAGGANKDAGGEQQDEGGGWGGSDEGDDVLDMALESMLDAQMAGEEFADDFED